MNNLDALRLAVPDAIFVRAFCTLGWENFADPQLGGQQLDLFYAGGESARFVAEQLIREIGLRSVCLGGLEAVPAVDGLTAPGSRLPSDRAEAAGWRSSCWKSEDPAGFIFATT